MESWVGSQGLQQGYDFIGQRKPALTNTAAKVLMTLFHTIPSGFSQCGEFFHYFFRNNLSPIKASI